MLVGIGGGARACYSRLLLTNKKNKKKSGGMCGDAREEIVLQPSDLQQSIK